MKKLHGEFKQRLEEQKNQLQCQHMCEMMHVICAEKNDAQKKLLKFQQGSVLHFNIIFHFSKITTNIFDFIL